MKLWVEKKQKIMNDDRTYFVFIFVFVIVISRDVEILPNEPTILGEATEKYRVIQAPKQNKLILKKVRNTRTISGTYICMMQLLLNKEL